jgi:hypothetical protein
MIRDETIGSICSERGFAVQRVTPNASRVTRRKTRAFDRKNGDAKMIMTRGEEVST